MRILGPAPPATTPWWRIALSRAGWFAGYNRPVYSLEMYGDDNHARRLGLRRLLRRRCKGIAGHHRARALDRGFRLGPDIICRRCRNYALDWPNEAIGMRVEVDNRRRRATDWMVATRHIPLSLRMRMLFASARAKSARHRERFIDEERDNG